ncbi:hypothetical protein RUM44_004904 [Polyplax serrata]|uniref:DUF4797 domain-containing protein n=1 Tax=Polyplax serrata TaxID=468196 RepID=A0ABR1B5W5_POLSC
MVVCDSYYLSAKSGDSSSRSPSPNRSLKGFNLFRVISQKIGRGIRQPKEFKCASSDDDEDSNSSVSSLGKSPKKPEDNSQYECEYFYKGGEPVLETKKPGFQSETDKLKSQQGQKKCLKFSTPCRHHHSSGSDTCSSNDDSSESNETDRKGRRSHSSSNESTASSSSSAESIKPTNPTLRKGLKSLNLNSKSLSCFTLSQMKEVTDRRESISKEKRSKKSPQKILRQPATHTYVRGISGLPTVKVSVINTNGCYNNQYSRG